MELRVRTARNTKDVDLSLPAGTKADVKEHVLQRLQAERHSIWKISSPSPSGSR